MITLPDGESYLYIYSSLDTIPALARQTDVYR